MRLASFSIWGVVIGLAGGCPSDGGSGGSADGGGTGTTMSETGHDHDETNGGSGVDPTTTTSPDTVGEASTGDEEASDTTSDPMFCDDLDACTACRACAIEGDCADEHAACQADEDCAALVDCLEACERGGEGDACEDACIADHSGGQALVLALHQCLVTACPNSCG